MQQVPTIVRDGDGNRVSHGIVERMYDKCRAILQVYVIDKQEDHMYVYMYCAHIHIQTHKPIIADAGLYKDIKFGDACEVALSNKDNIRFDEFEYVMTSMRRTGCRSACIYPLHSYSIHPCVLREYTYHRTDFPDGIVWWQDIQHRQTARR